MHKITSAADNLCFQSGKNGDLPEGMSLQYVDHGKFHHIKAIHPDDGEIGGLTWNKHEDKKFGIPAGEVENIWVHPEYQRRGVGNLMWDSAHSSDIEPKPLHSPDQTADGEGWARQAAKKSMPMIDLYHRTTKENVNKIYQEKNMHSKENDGGVFFTTFPQGDQSGGYGESVVHVRVPEHIAELDDEFPSGEQHYKVLNKHLRPHHFVESSIKQAVLKFTRDKHTGTHVAQDDSNHYSVYKENPNWNLEVRKLAETAGVRHPLGQPIRDSSAFETSSLAKRAAHHYSNLGEDYKPHEHGYKERMTLASNMAYDEERKKLFGSAKEEVHTGAMVALLPAPESISSLAISEGDPPDQLHVTLLYLGEAVEWPVQCQDELRKFISSIFINISQISAEINAHAVFNPNGDNPASVYLIGGHGGLVCEELHHLIKAKVEFLGVEIPNDFPLYIPHLTIGYGLDVRKLTYQGPIVFDRVRIVFGMDETDIPLRPIEGDQDENL